MTTSHHYDVVIIGGGIVGTTLACALHNTSLRCALIESSPLSAGGGDGTQFDLRVSAVTRASQRIFETIGAWPLMVQQRVNPFREMHVWDAAGRGEIHFDSAELGESLLGHIIENRVMTSALFHCLDKADNVTLIAGQRCLDLQRLGDAWQVELDNHQRLTADLVVGADGSHSWLRDKLQIRVRGWDYDHTALVTYVKTALSHRDTAWQRFLSTGPLAFLPLSDGYSSIVWSTRDSEAQRLRKLPFDEFAGELEKAIESRLGAIESIGPRATFPLRFLQTEHYVAPGIALLGDAAHTMHPLAGQGVNLGLTDAASLAEVLHDARALRQAIGSLAVLRRYERWRRADNLPMLAVVDGFQRLFDSQQPVLQWLRQSGMSALNSLVPVKNLVIDYAMGNRPDLPKLAKGENL